HCACHHCRPGVLWRLTFGAQDGLKQLKMDGDLHRALVLDEPAMQDAVLVKYRLVLTSTVSTMWQELRARCPRHCRPQSQLPSESIRRLRRAGSDRSVHQRAG